MSIAGIPSAQIGSPGTTSYLNYDFDFGYAFLSPAQPTLYLLGFNFDTDLRMLSRSTPDVTYSASADIRRFVDYGHKIIWFHGLSDPAVPVLGTIKYYEEMAQRFGGLERDQQFSRFYPIPNMSHCNGGAATDQFDFATPLANWVENGIPPGPINATGKNFTPATYQVSFVSGPATRTRPLCPYPQQARFTGTCRLLAVCPLQATRRIWLIRQNINASPRNRRIWTNGTTGTSSRLKASKEQGTSRFAALSLSLLAPGLSPQT